MDREAFQRQKTAHDIARLLNQLTAMGSTPEQPDFIFRIIDARSRHVIDSGVVDGVTARSVTSDLAAMADELIVEHDQPAGHPEQLPDLTPEEAAQVLHRQLSNMGPDVDRALMVTLRMPDGQYIGDVWLSARDVQDLTERAGTAADHRSCFEQSTTPAGSPVDEQQIAGLADQVEKFLAEGGI